MIELGDRWGAAGPPPEAYSRVTDSGRYAPLHAIARDLLDRLEREYDVRRVTGLGRDPSSGPETATNTTRPAVEATLVTLLPADPTSSPLGVIFTRFPGLLVRAGRDHETPIPNCGCDACDDTVEDCSEELERVAAAVVAGSLGERLVRNGGWWHEHWFEAPDQSWSGRHPLERDELTALRAVMPDGALSYAPWIRRPT